MICLLYWPMKMYFWKSFWSHMQNFERVSCYQKCFKATNHHKGSRWTRAVIDASRWLFLYISLVTYISRFFLLRCSRIVLDVLALLLENWWSILQKIRGPAQKNKFLRRIIPTSYLLYMSIVPKHASIPKRKRLRSYIVDGHTHSAIIRYQTST